MLSVTFRRLEILLAVVDERGFAAAANRLGIAQPSVSAHVKALERAVGGPLFERRRGRTPLLTELGRNVVKHAREMIAEAADLSATVVNAHRSGARRVVFSCQRSLANYMLKDALTEFALARRDIQLVIRIGKQEEVNSDVRDGIADIGCYLGNEDLREFVSEIVGRERLVLVAAPSHPLARRRKVSPTEVARFGFVGPPQSSHFGRALERLLSRAGIEQPKVVAQATEYQFLRELVAAGVGISCSPASSVAADIARGRLAAISLDAPELVFDVRLIHTPTRPLSDAARALTAYLWGAAGTRRA